MIPAAIPPFPHPNPTVIPAPAGTQNPDSW